MDTIEIKNLSYTYPGNVAALNDLTLSIPLRKKTAILGANGCGKSTLLQHMNGLLLPQKGSITIAGEQLTKKSADSIRKKVGLLFDNPDNQLFSPSVESDVEFGPSNLRMKKEDIKRISSEVMETCNITHLKDRPPYDLSLGQKKRCAIAGVLAMQPEILLMDEPFSGLDPLSLSSFLDTLQNLSKKGMTQIMSTHDVDIAYEWAENVIVMQGGKVLAVGGRELMQDAELMKTANLTTPTLVKLFSGFDHIPSSLEEGRQMLLSLRR